MPLILYYVLYILYIHITYIIHVLYNVIYDIYYIMVGIRCHESVSCICPISCLMFSILCIKTNILIISFYKLYVVIYNFVISFK